jgi:CRP/FNR family transcriptional regulator, cyclic AMP receptor protein
MVTTVLVSTQVLKGFEIFKGLSDSELSKIAEVCRERTFKAGDPILEEGTRAKELHLCRSGKVDITVWIREPWNIGVTVHQVEAGEVFGWSALVSPYIHTASAVAVEPVQEIYINGSELLDLFDNNPRIGYVVMTNVAVSIRLRLAQTTKKLSIDWLSSSGPEGSSSSWGEQGKR